MPKLGVSLPPSVLLPGCDNPDLAQAGGVGPLLAALKNEGVSHIELRAVVPGHDQALFAPSAAVVLEAALACTVHSHLADLTGAAFAGGIPAFLPATVFTVHALTGANVSAAFAQTAARLQEWFEALENTGQAHVLCIENNRKKGDEDPADSLDGAYALYKAVGSPLAGITFDFGHYYYNAVHYHNDPRMLPPPHHLAAVAHTHIHGIENDKTHFNLNDDTVPVAYYIDALKDAGFKGVYNLEITFGQFHKGGPLAGILQSVNRLAKAVL